MRQELEKSLYDVRHVKEDLLVYQVGDLESLSASALYTGEPCGPKIKVTGNKIVLPYANGLHDTFGYDRHGNLNDGHTTINLPGGGKIRINTGPCKARKDNSFNDK